MTTRRAFLAGAGGAALAAIPFTAGAYAGTSDLPPGGGHGGRGATGPSGSAGHGGGVNGATFRGGGIVDHAANGFDPRALLREFDRGAVTVEKGRTVRSWELHAQDREIEVAPGVRFPAWTFDGRIPGPTLRAAQGDRLRVRFVNDSEHPHTMHFHGIHPAEMDGVPMVGRGVIAPGESFTYEFDAEPFGVHLYHRHVGPLAEHIARGMYGTFVVDPPAAR